MNLLNKIICKFTGHDLKSIQYPCNDKFRYICDRCGYTDGIYHSSFEVIITPISYDKNGKISEYEIKFPFVSSDEGADGGSDGVACERSAINNPGAGLIYPSFPEQNTTYVNKMMVDKIQIEKILHNFYMFSQGTRVVMLINRSNGNTNKGSKRWINKIITTDTHTWEKAVITLMSAKNYFQEQDPQQDIRLYSCLNDRKMDKSIIQFMHKQLDLQDDMKSKFYSEINNSFCSTLMQPENKNSKFFLLDIDSADTTQTDKFISDNLIQVKHTYQTKKGWHYIVEPFNAMLANDRKDFTLQKDGLLLLSY